jgi:hypothetical protein
MKLIDLRNKYNRSTLHWYYKTNYVDICNIISDTFCEKFKFHLYSIVKNNIYFRIQSQVWSQCREPISDQIDETK